MRPVEKARARLRAIWIAVLRERAAPRQIGVAVGVGVFVGLSPAIGFHGGLAVAAATVLKVNRLFCFVGSRISNPLLGPFLVFAEVQVAHRARTGAFIALTIDEVASHARSLLVDWLLGMLLVGAPLSILLGFAAAYWARSRAHANREREQRDDGDADTSRDAGIVDQVRVGHEQHTGDEVRQPGRALAVDEDGEAEETGKKSDHQRSPVHETRS